MHTEPVYMSCMARAKALTVPILHIQIKSVSETVVKGS